MLSDGNLEHQVAARSQILIYKPHRKGYRWMLDTSFCLFREGNTAIRFTWWQDGETPSSFLCATGNSWMLLPSWSCCPNLSYCFCNLLFSPGESLLFLLSCFTRLELFVLKMLPMSHCPLAPSIFLSTASNVFCLSVIQASQIGYEHEFPVPKIFVLSK